MEMLLMRPVLGRRPRTHSFALSPSGFTLVELMMVVTIVGILASLAVPSYHRAVWKGREAALTQSLYTMRDVIDQYRADQGRYPATLEILVGKGYMRRIPVDPFTTSSGTWQVILDETDGGVFDVHSGSDLVAVNGTAYNEW